MWKRAREEEDGGDVGAGERHKVGYKVRYRNHAKETFQRRWELTARMPRDRELTAAAAWLTRFRGLRR